MENGRILIIEDNEFNLKFVRTLLKLEHYEVIETEDAEMGILKARNTSPDLILMDIQLPGMDGLEATRRIKEDPKLREIPVIALTAYAMDSDRTEALAAGCDDYLAKPFEPVQLLEIVKKHIGSKAG
jgi:CheY-like chemotaxis protein